MTRLLLGIAFGLTVLSGRAGAQVRLPDTVHVLADSLEWKLTYRATRFPSYVTSYGLHVAERSITRCELYRPGASLVDEWGPGDGYPLFYVPLANSRDLFAEGITLEKTRVFFDGHPPVDRLPSALEQRDAALLIRGTQLQDLYKTRVLRIHVTYSKDGVSGAGGFQRLEIDLAGMIALLPQFFDCLSAR